MRTLSSVIVVGAFALLQAGCLFGGRTPLNPNDPNNNQNNGQNNAQNNSQNNGQNNNVCLAYPVCPDGFDQVEQCSRNGLECKEVSICGVTIRCQAQDDPCLTPGAGITCPPDSRPVEACPPGGRCRTVQWCGLSLICMVDEVCAAPGCPEGTQPVERCAPEDPTCLVLESCGERFYCQDGIQCDAYPVCPEGSAQVQGCFEPDRCPECQDGSCFTQTVCGTTIVCGKVDCAPNQARGEGACRPVLGYSWNGQSCEMLAGCRCAGPGCDNLYDSQESCERAHATCAPQPVDCSPRNNAYFPLEVATVGGYAWDGRQCVAILGAGTCQGPDCPYVTPTLEACKTQFAQCLNQPGPTCAPQEAEGVGPCAAYFGVKFDGRQCVGVGGCSCQGRDCQSLYQDEASCRRVHAACFSGSCDRQDAIGVGQCDRFFGVAFNGAVCESVSGCSCQGADCRALYQDLESCKQATLQCAP